MTGCAPNPHDFDLEALVGRAMYRAWLHEVDGTSIYEEDNAVDVANAMAPWVVKAVDAVAEAMARDPSLDARAALREWVAR